MSRAPKIACPRCGLKYEPEAGLEAGQAHEALALLARFGKAAPLALEYVRLFDLPKRGLDLTRIVRILGEVVTLWEDGWYKFDGCTYHADKAAVFDALLAVCNSKTLDPPLPNHNYLKRTLHPTAQRAAAQVERRDEEAKQDNRDMAGRSGPPPEMEETGREANADLAEAQRAEVNALLKDGKSWESIQLAAKFRREAKQ